MSITVICPVFNQVHFSRRCFESLIMGADQPHEMIVIDNHSTDETPAYLENLKLQGESRGWKTRTITNAENVGVGRAFNQGISSSQSNYVVLINNDTWIMPGWDTALVSTMKRLGDASMIGPYYDETSFDPILTPQKAARFVARNSLKHSRVWASIFMFFKREVFDQIGCFDEQYFLTYEDRDLRERMDRKGLKYYKVGSCFIWHHSQGTRASGLIKAAYEEESLRKFVAKWGFDPRVQEASFLYRYRRKWSHLKNRFGFF